MFRSSAVHSGAHGAPVHSGAHGAPVHSGAHGAPTQAKRRSSAKRVLLAVCATLGISFVVLLAIALGAVLPYFRALDRAHLPPYHPFRSELAKQRYLAHYQMRSRAWPVPSRTLSVHTSWAETFVRISGPETARPLLLLPGGGQSSLMWAPMAAALAARFRVYAIDRPGDIGLSADTYGIRTADDLSHSVDDLLSALGLREPIDLVGMSYGGWQAADFAIRYPHRIRSLALVAPAATLFELPPDFAWVGVSSLLPGRYFVERAVRWGLPDLARRTDEPSRILYQQLVDDAVIGLRSFELRLTAQPRALTDQELSRLPKRTLFVVGEHEKLYPARKAIERLARTAAHVETALIPDAGHDLVWVQSDLVSSRLLPFVEAPPEPERQRSE